MADWQGLPGQLPGGDKPEHQPEEARRKSEEVESALLALGYKPQHAGQMVAALAESVNFAEHPTTELIRQALKQQNS